MINTAQRIRPTLLRTNFLIAAILLMQLCAFGQTVYVTNTGNKYHASSCRYLSKSKISQPIEKALEAGYTACSVCKPAVSVGTNTTSRLGQIENEPKDESSAQCTAKTKAGNRCSRMTKETNGRCWQHQ